MYASPYGKAYFRNIQNKLNKLDTNQVFILSIDPWSLSSTTTDPNDTLNFRENKSYLTGISNPNQKINYGYLFNYFDESYYKILTKNATAILQDNGWLEVTLPEDSISVERRRSFTIAGYQNKIDQYHFSSVRYDYLIKTIAYLKNFGTVYLVRLPVHPTLMSLENQLIPDLNNRIQTAIDLSNGYLDMSPDNAMLRYTDGVHLTKESGEAVSKKIGRWIIKKAE